MKHAQNNLEVCMWLNLSVWVIFAHLLPYVTVLPPVPFHTSNVMYVLHKDLLNVKNTCRKCTHSPEFFFTYCFRHIAVNFFVKLSSIFL